MFEETISMCGGRTLTKASQSQEKQVDGQLVTGHRNSHGYTTAIK